MEDEVVKYQPIGDELTIETAAIQAAFALDSSATIAEQQRDHGGLLGVAEAWMKLADFLAALRESSKPDKKDKTPFGFQTVNLDGTFDLQDENEEEDEQDVRDDADEPDED